MKTVSRLAAVVVSSAASAFAADARVNFITDATSPLPSPASSITSTGNTAGQAWTMKAEGSDFFVKPTLGMFDVWYTHNTAAPVKTRGVRFEMSFAQPISGLGFDLVDFGTLAINYGRMNTSNAGGIQSYTLEAYRNGSVVPLNLDTVQDHGSLISVNDAGDTIGGMALAFDAQATHNIGGGERDVSFRFTQPVDSFVLTTFDRANTTSVIGDTVSIRDVTFPVSQVPEPAAFGAIAIGAVMLMKRRRV